MISKELADHIEENLETFTLEILQTLHLVLFGEPEQTLIAAEQVKRLNK